MKNPLKINAGDGDTAPFLVLDISDENYLGSIFIDITSEQLRALAAEIDEANAKRKAVA